MALREMDMATLTDEALAKSCRAASGGDTRPFETLVARYKGRVFATAYRIMGNSHDAEEQAQEAFLRIYRGLRTLEDPTVLTGWIYRITTNVCLDALAARKHRPATVSISPVEGEQDLQIPETRRPTPEEAALRSEMRGCIERTLSGLDDSDRVMIVLRDIEGLAYQDIAAALKLGLSAAKMRIHRARHSFQQLIQHVCPDVWDRSAPQVPGE